MNSLTVLKRKKSMARKRGGPNRSAAIRAYKEKNADARPKEIAEGLA
jgi:hypothetical protein